MTPPTPQPLTAHILVGPTASGKSAIAQALAERASPPIPILSADAMAIYRDMNIGTAKPSAAQRAAVPSFGFDLASPASPFSVGAYLQAIRRHIPAITAAAHHRPILLVGGTGLYIKCLTEGLSPTPPPSPAARARALHLLNTAGLPALQAATRALSPHAYARLRDPNNPRRLLRAYELLQAGCPLPHTWTQPPPPILGLALPRPILHRRIAQRTNAIFASGLLDEVRALRTACPHLSQTARHAIGYAEAARVLDGTLSLPDAITTTIRRTCQYAKRQMTWFRHQANVHWLPLTGNETLPLLLPRITAAFATLPPAPLHGLFAVDPYPPTVPSIPP